MQTRESVINILCSYLKENKARVGFVRMGLFGSVARNEGDEDSDIDVGIELAKSNFFARMRIKEELEGIFQRSDVVSLRSVKLCLAEFAYVLPSELLQNLQQLNYFPIPLLQRYC